MHRILTTSLFCFAMGLPAQDVYVVGDSLGDNGNLFALIGEPGKPYWKGRFSDGPIYAEQLAKALRRTLHDRAIAGATTTDILQKQVKPLIAAHNGKLPANGLYVYWGGANDMLALLANPNADPKVAIGIAMAQTANALVAWIQAGAKEIVVLNLPDFSKTPRVLALNDPVQIAGVAALIQAYNQALAGTIAHVESLLKTDITEVDMFGLTREIVAHPHKFMLHNVTEPRMRDGGAVWPRAWRFLFFDDIHPTFGGHRALMWRVMRELGEPIRGDVNGDYLVNVRDLLAMWRHRGKCKAPCPADLNGDRRVDGRDRRILLRMLARS